MINQFELLLLNFFFPIHKTLPQFFFLVRYLSEFTYKNLKRIKMKNEALVLPVKYKTQPFGIQNISEQDESIHIYINRSLIQISQSIHKHCHVFTKVGVTNNEKSYHTAYSFSKYPPEYLLFCCERSDRIGGGIYNIIALSSILRNLSAKSIGLLQQSIYYFSLPHEQNNNPSMEGFAEEKLPILYADSKGELSIRYNYDIISQQGLPKDNLLALQELRNAVEACTPVSLLKDNESIYFNNGKYLYEKTEFKDSNRLIHPIMFNRRTQIKGQIYQQFNHRKDAKYLAEKYIEEFKGMANMPQLPLEEEVFHSDMIEFSKQFNGLEFLQRCLYAFYRAIVHLYDQDSEMGQKTRNILEWPTKVEKMLRGLNQKRKFLPHFYRPDFILHEDEITGKCGLKICEVNTRFTTNTYIISLMLNEILCKSTNKTQDSQNFKVVSDAILKEFANGEQIYFITNLTKLWDPILLSKILKEKTEREIIIIRTQDLSINAQKLFCKSTQRVIHNAILELKQEEIIQMPQDVFEALAYETHCINDLRSIFICHDKRLLSIIHDPEFYDFLRNKYLQNTELDFLRAHTVKTWNKHCTDMVEQSIKNREKFVLKVPHEGKSQKMLFGFENSLEEWKTYIQSMNTFILQEYVPRKKMPIIDIHDPEQGFQIYTTVGTFLCYDDQMWGMGMFRCGLGAGVCLSNNGFFLGARIIQDNSQKNPCLQTLNDWQLSYNHLSEQEVKDLALKKYTDIKFEADGTFKIIKSHLRNMKTNWKSKYISPTGGSTKKKTFIANGFEENHYLRRCIAREFLKHEIITPQDVGINIFVGKNLYRSKQIFNEICELCGSSPIPLDFSVKEQYFEEMMHNFQANMILGVPSMIVRFAHYFVDKPALQITKILYASEHLFTFDKKIIERAFPNAKIYSVFGSAQTGVWAYSFGGLQDYYIYHYLSEAIKLQVDNPDERGIGKLLCTNLVRRETPIYRYEQGDYIKIINRNTFQLAPKPEIMSFRIDACDFQVEDIQKVMTECKKWQIILRPNFFIEFRFELPDKEKNDKVLEEIVKIKFKSFMETQIKSQGWGKNITVNSIVAEDEKGFITCFPSNKLYYVVDERETE